MGLTRYKLGDLIELCTGGNESLKYGPESVKGISVNKEFIGTKADLTGVSLSNYTVVEPKCFAFVTVTSRNGNKISIAYNTTQESFLTSSFYVTFKLNNYGKQLLLEDYLFMFFNRHEFDRYARRDSWGSAREYFYYDNIKEVIIDLPPIEIQKKYVDIYNSMLANQQCYERGLEDLKLVCDAYIENLRREIPCQTIGPYINRINEKNGSSGIKNVKSVSTSKELRKPSIKVNRNELSNYKIVKPDQFTFVQTTHNEKVFAYALNNTGEDIVVTPVNEVFSVNENVLIPEYLAMFFNRAEFDRYARYHSWGSARETFTWDDLVNVEIPIIFIEKQRAITDIYNVYKQRKAINEKLKAQIKDICPILIKGSLEEASR